VILVRYLSSEETLDGVADGDAHFVGAAYLDVLRQRTAKQSTIPFRELPPGERAKCRSIVQSLDHSMSGYW